MSLPPSRAAIVLLCGALLAGIFSAGGGLDHGSGLIVLGLAGLAALLVARAGGAFRLRRLLFAPFLAALLSLATALIPGLGLEWTARLLFFALIASILAGLIDHPNLTGTLIAGAVLLALSIISEARADIALLGRESLGLSRGGYLHGANAAGIALALSATPFFLHLHSAYRVNRFIYIALATLVVLALGLTGSRTGLIALAGGLIVPFLLLPRRGRVAIVVILVAIIAFGAVLYLPRFIDRLDPDYLTNRQRIGMVRTVMKGLEERPWLGHGPWSYSVISPRYQHGPKWELHPHSVPLRVLFESGIVGGLAWAAFASVLWFGRRSIPRYPASAGIALGILAGSLTDDLLWLPLFSLLLFIALAPFTTAVEIRARGLSIACLLLAGFLAAILPAMHEAKSGLPGEPNSRIIDRAIEQSGMPDFTGWEEDPVALRIAAFRALEAGDTHLALARLKRVAEIDPMMIWTPNRLDLAWLATTMNDRSAAMNHLEEARRIAPVLVSWYRGETTPIAPSLIDRHHGIEFPDPFAISLEMVPPGEDYLHWTHHRGLVARALLAGDTPSAIRSLDIAEALARKQYGTDPLLCRLGAMIRPDATVQYLDRARSRTGPAHLWRVFAPLVYRIPVTSTGEIAPWRRERTP
jgi:O-antigen ligase